MLQPLIQATETPPRCDVHLVSRFRGLVMPSFCELLSFCSPPFRLMAARVMLLRAVEEAKDDDERRLVLSAAVQLGQDRGMRLSPIFTLTLPECERAHVSCPHFLSTWFCICTSPFASDHSHLLSSPLLPSPILSSPLHFADPAIRAEAMQTFPGILNRLVGIAAASTANTSLASSADARSEAAGPLGDAAAPTDQPVSAAVDSRPEGDSAAAPTAPQVQAEPATATGETTTATITTTTALGLDQVLFALLPVLTDGCCDAVERVRVIGHTTIVELLQTALQQREDLQAEVANRVLSLLASSDAGERLRCDALAFILETAGLVPAHVRMELYLPLVSNMARDSLFNVRQHCPYALAALASAMSRRDADELIVGHWNVKSGQSPRLLSVGDRTIRKKNHSHERHSMHPLHLDFDQMS